MANIYGHPDGNALIPPSDFDSAPFHPLPNPLTPRLLAVREQALTDMAAADEERAKAAWLAYCARNGMDPAAMPERYRDVWTWAWGLYQPKGGDE